jgi:hypothetical protein
MRIAFLCGSQELGRDGVGDYTAGLAEELCLQGHEVMVISLRDRFVIHPVSIERPGTGGGIPVVRLPATLAWPESIAQARKALDRFAPEWVSLQFVGYSFHPKGIVYGLARKLSSLMTGRRLHVMFHEIWLSRELGWSGKHRAVGALQRFFIQRFIAAAKPQVIHTSNAPYAALLQRSGISASVVSLFGAITVPPVSSTAWIESQLSIGLGGAYRRDAFWLFGFFGALHAQWPPEPLLTHLYRSAKAAGKKPVLLFLGRTGSVGEELWNRIARDYADRFTFLRFGEQPAAYVSEYLTYLDCGLATTPRSIIGKSSTVTSMLEHGLPVIVNREDAFLAAPVENHEPLFLACATDLEARLQAGLTKGPRGTRRAAVTQAFVSSLLPPQAAD